MHVHVDEAGRYVCALRRHDLFVGLQLQIFAKLGNDAVPNTDVEPGIDALRRIYYAATLNEHRLIIH
jgi:hypothetical protein